MTHEGQRWEPIYDTVLPYRGYDQFQSLAIEQCDAFAVGVGLFSAPSGVTERNSVVLRRADADRFTTERLPFDGDVITQRVVVAAGKSWVTALVRRDSETLFEAVRLDECAKAPTRTMASAIALKIAHLEAPRPNNATFIGPPIEGTLLLPLSAEGSFVRLVVYDGRVLQTFNVDLQASPFKVARV